MDEVKSLGVKGCYEDIGCKGPDSALGHWFEYSNGKLTRYQIITPTYWNASPRDDNGVSGTIEQALQGVQLSDPSQPIELLRIVRSFMMYILTK